MLPIILIAVSLFNPPVIVYCGKPQQIIWTTGDNLTTWPVMWGKYRDPTDPNKYLVTFMQMRRKSKGTETQTYTQGSNGALYRFIGNNQIELISQGEPELLQSGSPLFVIPRSPIPGEPNDN